MPSWAGSMVAGRRARWLAMRSLPRQLAMTVGALADSAGVSDAAVSQEADTPAADRDDRDRYRHRMPELIAPTTRLHSAWIEARDEWGPGLHEDGFGVQASDEVDSPTGFAAWVARLVEESDPVGPVVEAGQIGCLYRWIVEGDRVLGGIALRYGLNDYVLEFGHIGYGIRPSSRRRGLATWALGRMLDEARTLGLDRVLLVCAVDNLASAKTIEQQGGVLEGVRDIGHGPARRYWISI